MKLIVISVISVISEFPERGVTGIVGNAYNFEIGYEGTILDYNNSLLRF